MELKRVYEYKTALTHFMDGQPTGNLKKKPEDKWVDLMEYIDEIIEYLGKQVKNMKEELIKFESVVNKLPARERTVIRARYIAGVSFKEIEKKLPLSERTIYHAHRNGIAQLDMSLFE